MTYVTMRVVVERRKEAERKCCYPRRRYAPFMVDVLERFRRRVKEFGRRVPDTHVEQGQIFFTPGDRSEALFRLKKGR